MIPAPSAWQLRHSPPAKPCRGQARYGRAFCGVSATAATTWRLSRLSGQLLLRPTRDSARLASEKPELLSDLAGLADFGCDDTGCTVDVDASSNGSTSMKEDELLFEGNFDAWSKFFWQENAITP